MIEVETHENARFPAGNRAFFFLCIQNRAAGEVPFMMLASRYWIQDELGSGGMGRVHLARVEGPGGFHKWVAVKRLHEHLLASDAAVRMFLDEGRIAARIAHPNVVAVLDVGEADGATFIAMEYLHGEPLREIMRRASALGAIVPPQIACRILADAAEGLHAAHEVTGDLGEPLSLVHRDVSPQNLFVTYDGVTKIVDFGVAEIRTALGARDAGARELKGKLAYMSPEQTTGGPLDRRTDVFALGVVAWELTTGRRLFRGASDAETMMRVRECNVPRPSALVRDYPIDLEQVVMKALDRDPSQRYATARQFARAIQLMLMSRGELVGREDVAACLRALMPDRIAEREARLRALMTPDGAAPSPEPCAAVTLTDPTAVDARARTCPMSTLRLPPHESGCRPARWRAA